MDARFYLETERSKRESPIVEMGENCVALEFYLEKRDLYIQGIKWRTVIYMLVGLSFLNTKPGPAPGFVAKPVRSSNPQPTNTFEWGKIAIPRIGVCKIKTMQLMWCRHEINQLSLVQFITKKYNFNK